MNEDKYDEDLVERYATDPETAHYTRDEKGLAQSQRDTLARMARAQREAHMREVERAEKAEAELDGARDAIKKLRDTKEALDACSCNDCAYETMGGGCPKAIAFWLAVAEVVDIEQEASE